MKKSFLAICMAALLAVTFCFVNTACSSDSEGTPVTFSFDNGDSIIVHLDEVATMKVSAFIAVGDTVNLEWMSDNTYVATVQDGIVTPHKTGNATITVTSPSGRTAQCCVKVKPRLVSSVEILPGDTTLCHIGDTMTARVKILPETATSKKVTWKSSDNKVAIVNGAGFIKIAAFGTAKISVTAQDGSNASDTLYITATPVKVQSVTINATSKDMYIGETFKLEATVKPEDALTKTLSWSSSDNTVVSVDGNGLVTAHKQGTATVTVASTDGTDIKTTCQITVSPKLVSTISLNKTSLSLGPNESQKLTATISPNDATSKNVTWTSSNTSVATVSSTGEVKALSVGTAVITVSAKDGSGVKATYTVKVANILISSITLNHTSLSLTDGETATLTATITPTNATSKNVKWSSSNTKVASVSSTGVVTATGIGSATITVFSTDGSNIKNTCQVTVNPIKVTSITLSQSSLTIEPGSEVTLKTGVVPANATNQTLSWSSTNNTVATVSQSGLVTAKALGTATISVKATDGSNVQASCQVTVKNITYDDLVTANRTGTSQTYTSSGAYYGVTWQIHNSSSITIHVVSIAGNTDIACDIPAGSYKSITLYGSTAYIQNYYQKFIFTAGGKQYENQI